MLHVAVLFLVFNRPDSTSQVFEAIRQSKPLRLYVAADGPREGSLGEAERVAKVREVATAVDWPCDVKTLFRANNLGCKCAVSGAITWFFKQEEQGIILEDDCLPNQSFFGFCEHMLERYKDNKKIWMINGFNPRYPGVDSSKCFLSQNPSVWGWASWRDRWEKYDVEMPYWKIGMKLEINSEVPNYVHRYYEKVFERTQNGLINTWDYQLSCLIFQNKGFVIKPYANLVCNIGVEGAHARVRDLNHFIATGSFQIEHSGNCVIDLGEDLWFYKTRLSRRLVDFPLRAFNKLRRTLS